MDGSIETAHDREKPWVLLVAFALLAVMAVLMFSSIRHDSIIVDEDPHIGAGYSYLRMGDYRLNPEHPPLIKDLGAFPLLFQTLNEPWTDKSWATDINGQWEFGRKLIFGSGNDADAITQAAKKPMIIFTVLLGLIIFWWARKNFGNAVALLALFFYTFSPTFLAHGRLVTTDVGAAAGFFIGTIAFLRFLKDPRAKNVILAGLALGFALLTKFSTFELLPIEVILAVVWVAVYVDAGHRFRALIRYGILTAAIFAIAYAAIYPVYLHHTRNYPPERQKTDSKFILSSFSVGVLKKASPLMEAKNILPQYALAVRDFPKNAVIWAADKPILRPWSEYFLGLLMVFQRSAGGNTTYFLGEVSNTGSPIYFPLVYLMKEPLVLHILALVALIFVVSRIRRPDCRREWLQNHFVKIAFLVVIAFYWWTSISSNLNIGVRHVLPTFPFIYLLVSNEIVKLYRSLLPQRAVIRIARAGLAVLLIWQAASVLKVHPSYLAYFNEVAGGPDGGYRYVTDSNLDWGQDLRRLAEFVEARGIPEISVDYFGWADPAYYLKERYRWLSSSSEPRKGWIAVSATFYQGSRQEPEHDYRRWLTMDKLVAKIGYSIFVFRVD